MTKGLHLKLMGEQWHEFHRLASLPFKVVRASAIDRLRGIRTFVPVHQYVNEHPVNGEVGRTRTHRYKMDTRLR